MSVSTIYETGDGREDSTTTKKGKNRDSLTITTTEGLLSIGGLRI